jgi:hypothetical protein
MKAHTHLGLGTITCLGLMLWGVVRAEPSPWRDPSPHQVRFVTVAPNVNLETLDWVAAGDRSSCSLVVAIRPTYSMTSR